MGRRLQLVLPAVLPNAVLFSAVLLLVVEQWGWAKQRRAWPYFEAQVGASRSTLVHCLPRYRNLNPSAQASKGKSHRLISEKCSSSAATRGDDGQGCREKLFTRCSTTCGVKVWFSEEDIRLGVPFLREIDRGLAKSRVGIVLVTPNSPKSHPPRRKHRP